MGKNKIAAGDFSDVDPGEGFDKYEGERPEKNFQARFRVARIMWGESQAGNQKMTFIFNVAQQEGKKNAEYNGYTIFHTATLTQKSAPFVNALLDALGISRKAVWGGNMTLSDDKKFITKIGGKSVEGLYVIAKAVYDGDYDNHKIATNSWVSLVKKATDDDEDDGPSSAAVDDDDEPETPKAKKPKKAKKAKPVEDDDEDDEDSF